MKRASAPIACYRPSRWTAIALLLCLTGVLKLGANPKGMTAVSGNVAATQNGSQLTVQASQNAVIQWQSFNIQPGETTTFVQPSSKSVVWNQIQDQNPSQIWGALNANGYVVLMNQNGFYFGPNSVVNVGGLMVTTAQSPPPESSMGGQWQFNGMPPLASIVNYGQIKAQSGSSVYLIAEKVENHGTISAPQGTVGLFAGKEVLVSDQPDGRGLSATVRLPEGSVDNRGQLIADAGTIMLQAQVVNQGGLVQANSVREHNGVIELVASERINLGEESVLAAKGDSSAVSDGGRITIKSAGSYADSSGSQISVAGSTVGGNGGQVEISAANLPAIHAQIDGSAKEGWMGGSLKIDPTDIVLSTGGSDSAGSGTVLANDAPSTLRLNVGSVETPLDPTDGNSPTVFADSAFKGFSQISLQATRDITLTANTRWDLFKSTWVNTPGSVLTLEAGRNISFGDNASIRGSPGWSLRLAAGADFSAPLSVRAGAGSIYLNGGAPDANGQRPNGSGSLESADGSITLVAGHEVLVGSGFVRTVGGGSISITTLDGDVDAGTKGDWYQFSRFGYSVARATDGSINIGGIATASGGDVSINAGRDILSFVPNSGALGAEPGNVTLQAGRRIQGRYMLRNGQGLLAAGVALKNGNNTLENDEIVGPNADIGSASNPVSLGLATGSWRAFAAQNIFLNEVYNPNGSLNNNRLTTGARIRFQFDYDPGDRVLLTAGNSVQLLGNNPAHVTDNRDRLPIYPGQLEIHAGAGGVLLGNDVILFPSPQGNLDITTTDGGSLKSTPGRFSQLIMSDSGLVSDRERNTPPPNPKDVDLASGHALIPVHRNDSVPAEIKVDGNMENVFVRLPKKAEVTAGGSTLNFSFEGQNLSPGDVTRISIGGDYTSRSDRTFATVASAISVPSVYNQIALLNSLSHAEGFSIFDPRITLNGALGARLTYNPQTRRLGIQGIMTAEDRDFLLHPTVLAVDANGFPILDAQGAQMIVPATFTTDSAAILQLYQNSQDIPTSGLAYKGLQIGGPGTLAISAHNLDLGISQGIRSVGTLLNPYLLAVSTHGADLAVNLGGKLELTSSQIASFNGGSINLVAGGALGIGSQEQFTSDDTPKGVYTAHGGNVTLTAGGDIDVNGSRIATYDGGDITVASSGGSVDAGQGAKGFFTVTTEQLNPTTKKLELRNDKFFGSGIVALTRVDSDAEVGNISVSTPNGDITANSGGILQLAFNQVGNSSATVSLDAGGNIEALNSGVLGANVNLHAKGDIKGLVVANQNIVIDAKQSVTVTALGGGSVSVNAGGNVAGNIVGGGAVAVSGGEGISASVISTGGGAGAGEGGASGSAFKSVAAPVAQQTTTDADKAVAKGKETDSDEELKKKLEKPLLAKTTGRVTVILPGK